jgi:hypothetical protein
MVLHYKEEIMVFKVVLDNPNRPRPYFRSAFVAIKHGGLKYTIGQTTHRPKTGGPILAFATLEDAVVFHASCLERIFRCEATNVVNATGLFILAYPTQASDRRRFWSKYKNGAMDRPIEGYCGYMNVPSGTVFCDSVTPIEDVTPQTIPSPY